MGLPLIEEDLFSHKGYVCLIFFLSLMFLSVTTLYAAQSIQKIDDNTIKITQSTEITEDIRELQDQQIFFQNKIDDLNNQYNLELGRLKNELDLIDEKLTQFGKLQLGDSVDITPISVKPQPTPMPVDNINGDDTTPIQP